MNRRENKPESFGGDSLVTDGWSQFFEAPNSLSAVSAHGRPGLAATQARTGSGVVRTDRTAKFDA
jgi:hypothetical protein